MSKFINRTKFIGHGLSEWIDRLWINRFSSNLMVTNSKLWVKYPGFLDFQDIPCLGNRRRWLPRAGLNLKITRKMKSSLRQDRRKSLQDGLKSINLVFNSFHENSSNIFS